MRKEKVPMCSWSNLNQKKKKETKGSQTCCFLLDKAELLLSVLLLLLIFGSNNKENLLKDEAFSRWGEGKLNQKSVSRYIREIRLNVGTW